jgi:hypothetical protein
MLKVRQTPRAFSTLRCSIYRNFAHNFSTTQKNATYEIRSADTLFQFQIKNAFIFNLELECATGRRAEMRSISRGKAGPHSRRSRQIKTAGRNFYLEIELDF